MFLEVGEVPFGDEGPTSADGDDTEEESPKEKERSKEATGPSEPPVDGEDTVEEDDDCQFCQRDCTVIEDRVDSDALHEIF